MFVYSMLICKHPMKMVNVQNGEITCVLTHRKSVMKKMEKECVLGIETILNADTLAGKN